MNNPTIRVITDLKEFKSLAGVWNNLLQKCGDDNSIYLTREWLFTWWQHFGEGKKLNILLVEKERKVIAIVPLMRTEYKALFIRFHILETIGGPSLNYIGIFPPENRQEAMAALLLYLENALRSNLVLKLSLIHDDSQVFDLLHRQVALLSNDLLMQVRLKALAPYIPLSETWEGYFRSISHKRRAILRQALRLLENSHTVELQEYTADSLDDGLSEFFDLHQKRWQSVDIKSIFSNPKIQEFYRDVSSHFLKRGWLHFSCLMVDNQVASAVWSFIYNRKFHATTVARDVSYAKYSVGHLHYMYLIKDAIKKQLREFDFQQGEEPYKFYWTKTARKYMSVIVIKKGFGSGLRFKCVNVFLLFRGIRQCGLIRSYRLHMSKRGWEKENKRLGLACH
ncbi:GNAT family N-acetyltransferase [Chloroflexota bacterium]